MILTFTKASCYWPALRSSKTNPFHSHNGEDIPVIILTIKEIEAHIPFIAESRVHIALHLMEEIQIVHQLVEDIAATTLSQWRNQTVREKKNSTIKPIKVFHQTIAHPMRYLDEDSSVGVSMRIDGAGGSLTTNVAGKGDAHPPARRFSEERPRKRWDSPIAVRLRCGGTFHSRARSPTSPNGRAQNQTHRFILTRIQIFLLVIVRSNEIWMVYAFNTLGRWQREPWFLGKGTRAISSASAWKSCPSPSGQRLKRVIR